MATTATPTTTASFPLPPILTHPSSSPPELITQGAEGRLYKTTYLIPSLPCALKYRPPKPYRHPALDARLTRARILAEARVLGRLRREGVPVPAVYAVDEAAGWLMMEWVGGGPVRAAVNSWLGERRGRGRRPGMAGIEEEGEVEGEGKEEEGGVEELGERAEELAGLMRRIGGTVGKLHASAVVHGDLTTSNMMLRPWPAEVTNGAGEGGQGAGGVLDGEVVLIDFGLASQSTLPEDRAVDLYVLERAFGSTHPRAESLFGEILQGYKETFKQAGPVLKKLEDVRMRGRKRSMVG